MAAKNSATALGGEVGDLLPGCSDSVYSVRLADVLGIDLLVQAARTSWRSPAAGAPWKRRTDQ